MSLLNRPFPSCLLPLFENESSCETIHENEFDFHENENASKTHFHMNGFDSSTGNVTKTRGKKNHSVRRNSYFALNSPETIYKNLSRLDYATIQDGDVEKVGAI